MNRIETTTLANSADIRSPNVGSRDDAKAIEVAQGFESVFLQLLLEPLENAESFFGDDSSGRVFGGMFRQHIADAMAKRQPLGIGSFVLEQLRRNAEDAAPQGSNDGIDALGDATQKLRDARQQQLANARYGRIAK